MDYLLIDILRGLVYAVVLGLIVVTVKWAFTSSEQPALPDDADFDEFYCDLCASDLTVDFTREETEILYRTWQQQRKESERC